MSQPEWAPPSGDIDAFGKGKGKGKDQPRQPLECYGCFGEGHPQRLCPTLRGFAGKPGAGTCGNCKGKGHSAQQCTSKGGGKHEQPGLPTGKGKGKDGGKGWGKGFGSPGGGKGKGWGGKGKGKVYGVDEQYFPEWPQGPDWSLAQSGAAAQQ